MPRPLRVKMLNITNEVLSQSPSVDHLLSSTPWPISQEEAGEARACSDPLSFASFLAFALAVSNLVMNNMRKRRKRSVKCRAERRLEERLEQAVATVFTGMLRTVLSRIIRTIRNSWDRIVVFDIRIL